MHSFSNGQSILKKVVVDKYGFLKFGGNMCSAKLHNQDFVYFGNYIPYHCCLVVLTKLLKSVASSTVRSIEWFKKSTGERNVEVVIHFMDGLSKCFKGIEDEEIEIFFDPPAHLEEPAKVESISFCEGASKLFMNRIEELCCDFKVPVTNAVEHIQLLIKKGEEVDKHFKKGVQQYLIDDIAKCIPYIEDENQNNLLSRLIQCGLMLFE